MTTVSCMWKLEMIYPRLQQVTSKGRVNLDANFEEGGSSKGEEGCEGSWSGGERWWRHCLRRRFLAIRRVSARSKSNSTATRAEKYFNSLLAVLRSFGRRWGGRTTSRPTTTANSQQPARWRRRGGQATLPPRGHRMQRWRRRGQQSWFNRLPAAAAAAVGAAASEGQRQVLRAARM